VPSVGADMSDASERTQVVTDPAAPLRSGNDEAPTVISTGASRAAPPPSTAPQDAGVLQPGTRVAEFEITGLIGQGGFGAVYQAWDHALERVVAIKEYLPTSLSTRQGDGIVVPLSERHRETFELGMVSFGKEAKLLAQFDHPSLLKVYRSWQERGTTYMAMPLYRGDTMRQALSAITGGVDERWLMRIVDGVTQALAVMHSAHCYHRDVAPDNIILLEGSGRPVLLDFGAARRVITDKTQAITVILKPGYAPIEQYAEVPDMSQGAWTDVYALAAVMHVAVCNRAPPPSVARLLSDSYVPLAGNTVLRQRYSLALLSAIDAGLGVRPEQRPQSMGALRAALGLEEVVTQDMGHGLTQGMPGMQGTGGHPRSTAPAPPGRARTVPLAGTGGGVGKLIAIAAAVLVAIGAGGGAWWWTQRNGGDAKVPPAVAGQDIKPGGPTQPEPPKAEPPIAAPVAPAAPVARTPSESLASLASAATPGWDVVATPRKAEVTIGKDKLGFEVRSNKDGYVYTYLLSSGGELFLLFPNLLDKRNKIVAGTPLQLPRPAWPMDSGGPAGANQFVVMVSEKERDFAATGLQNDGVFPQFPLAALAALELARGSGPPPLAGKPVCATGGPCDDVFGVGNFRIVEK